MGIHSVSLPVALPVGILRPALVLAVGGVLTAATARSPLRLACGVLLALTGFEMAYAHVDPGVLITAGLATFQLLLAVVAAYVVGLAVQAREAP
jgi:hypothetical protein